MPVTNGRVVFAEAPTAFIVPGTHIKFEKSEIDLESIKLLNGEVLAKTRVLSPDPYMRGRMRVRDPANPNGFDLGKPYAS